MATLALGRGAELIRRHLVAQRAAGQTECMATLASAAGIGRSTLSRFLSGAGDLRAGILDAILRKTGHQLCIVPVPEGPSAPAPETQPSADAGKGNLDDLLRAASQAGFELRLVPPVPAPAAPFQSPADAAPSQEQAEAGSV